MDTRDCPDCGHTQVVAKKFCTHCGFPIERAVLVLELDAQYKTLRAKVAALTKQQAVLETDGQKLKPGVVADPAVKAALEAEKASHQRTLSTLAELQARFDELQTAGLGALNEADEQQRLVEALNRELSRERQKVDGLLRDVAGLRVQLAKAPASPREMQEVAARVLESLVPKK